MTEKKTIDATKPGPEFSELVTGLSSLALIKDGWRTTEFKLVALSLLVGIAALALPVWLGVAHPAAVVVASVWAVMANAGVINYTSKRTAAKAEAQKAADAADSEMRLRNDNPNAIVADVLPEAPQL
jgi:hypothetical protein